MTPRKAHKTWPVVKALCHTWYTLEIASDLRGKLMVKLAGSSQFYCHNYTVVNGGSDLERLGYSYSPTEERFGARVSQAHSR